MTVHTAPSIEGIVKRIASFLEANSVNVDGIEDVASFPLLESGALDSLGVLNLMMFLAEEYRLEIEDEDFTPENFRTMASLAELVISKQSA